MLETTNNPANLKRVRGIYRKKVDNFVEYVKSPKLKPANRVKLITLITIEEHNREIIERLWIDKITSPKQFQWLQQLRIKRQEESMNTELAILLVDHMSCKTFMYGYEY